MDCMIIRVVDSSRLKAHPGVVLICLICLFTQTGSRTGTPEKPSAMSNGVMGLGASTSRPASRPRPRALTLDLPMDPYEGVGVGYAYMSPAPRARRSPHRGGGEEGDEEVLCSGSRRGSEAGCVLGAVFIMGGAGRGGGGRSRGCTAAPRLKVRI